MPDDRLPLDDGWFRPYFIVDDQFIVRAWPDATARVLGCHADQAIGRPCAQLLGCGGCGEHGRCLQLALPGEHAWMIWRGMSHLQRGVPGNTTIEAILIRSLMADAESTGTIDAMLEAIRRACAADDCEMFLLDPAAREVVLCGCAGVDRAAFLERTRMALGEGYPGLVAGRRRPLFSDHLMTDLRFVRNGVKARGIRTFAGVPVSGDDGRLVGYLGVGWKQATVPANWALRLLDTLVPLAGRVADALARPDTALAGHAWTVRGFGLLELHYGRTRITSASFRRQKSADLLRHLLIAPAQELPRDALIEHLWPGVSAPVGANRLHVVLHDVRSMLRDVAPGTDPLVEHRLGRYRLATVIAAGSDIRVFQDLLSDARAVAGSDPTRAVTLLERAMSICRSDLFSDSGDLAFERPRERFRRLRDDAVTQLAELRTRLGGQQTALPRLDTLRHPGSLMPVDGRSTSRL